MRNHCEGSLQSLKILRLLFLEWDIAHKIKKADDVAEFLESCSQKLGCMLLLLTANSRIWTDAWVHTELEMVSFMCFVTHRNDALDNKQADGLLA